MVELDLMECNASQETQNQIKGNPRQESGVSNLEDKAQMESGNKYSGCQNQQ